LEISCQDVKKQQDAGQEFLLLDCREQSEYDHVHLAGATLLPMSEITERVSEIEQHRETPVVVYCHHGARSLRVAQWLDNQGFKDVKSMAGGIDVWSLEIDPALPRYE